MAADVGIEATAVGAWAMPEPDDDETDQADFVEAPMTTAELELHGRAIKTG